MEGEEPQHRLTAGPRTLKGRPVRGAVSSEITCRVRTSRNPLQIQFRYFEQRRSVLPLRCTENWMVSRLVLKISLLPYKQIYRYWELFLLLSPSIHRIA